MAAVWSFPTRIVFGTGEALCTGRECADLAVRRALIVTDPGVVAAGLLERIVASLDEAGILTATFTGVASNPTESDIEAGTRAYADHEADGVVAVGGGSPIDAGKLIALRAVVKRSFEELDDAQGGGRHITAPLPPVVALPTTAGTGSEVGRAAVVTVRSTGRKTVIFSPRMLPRVAVLDPELTRSMPPRTTAATGFDALTHCLEAYVSVGDHPMADAVALAGLGLIAQNLERAVSHGEDLDARGAMMKAAMMGAVAFQKGLGACHSLAHPLSSVCGLHHGLANALCLPAVVDFNESVAGERLVRVATLFGARAERGSSGEALRQLRRRIGLPASLGEAGVSKELLPRLADLAVDDACHRENPRPCSRGDLLSLYENSY